MLPGDVVSERFEILRTAGSGGMGVVYQARDRTSGIDVALKVLIGGEAGLEARFAQEVEVLSALEHPHIVGYVTHGTTASGAPYLVMPWLEGHDLQERIRARPLSVDETLTVARCVGEALACLHQRGLVHRDLKPSNLFLPEGKLATIQVIDLGIARGTVPLRPLTLSGVLLGTPGFIAPEQAYGPRDVAPAVDIFALGCVLFECLTGRRLFSGEHVMAVLAKILLEEAPRIRELRPDVPEALERLIDRMVAKEPELRPQDGAQLLAWIDDLDRAPSPSGRSPLSVSLTAIERRVITVLVVVLAPARASIAPSSDVTRAEINPVQELAAPFGVQVHVLAEGTAIVSSPEDLSAGDGAALLARFGMFLANEFPGAKLALAAGSAVTGIRLPVGEAIDRGVTMVRSVGARGGGEGVQIDDISAGLLTSRFDIRREAAKLFLQAERLSLDPTRPLLGRPTSCVGRERELTILEATVDECIEGAGPKVVLVTAPAGAGKSRLRHELVRRLGLSSSPPITVLHCQGDPLHATTPYAQIAQVVRYMTDLRVREDAALTRERLLEHVKLHLPALPSADVMRITDFLGELLGASFDDENHLLLRAARHNESAMADQIRLAFEDILRAWCKDKPLLLVMEDLHWSDAMSIRIIDGALRRLAGTPLLVLALARSEVHERFPQLWSNRHVTEIRLPPLSPQASGKLVSEVMGADTANEAIDRIVARSEGNAFYLEELIRAAVERAKRRSSIPPPMDREGLPATIIAMAQARLERLDPEVRKVLRAASIFGERFWIEGVCALVGEPLATVMPIVDVLIDQEAIVPAFGSRLTAAPDARELTFRHDLLRGAAYATLTPEDRALGHRLAAEWLEGVDEDREVIALHWLEGGDRRRAAVAFSIAGDARLARAQADAAARCAVRSLLVANFDACHGASDDALAIAHGLRILSEGLEIARRLDTQEVLEGLEPHLNLPDGVRASHAARTTVHVAIDRALEALRDTPPVILASAYADAACALGALSYLDEAKGILAGAAALLAEDDASSRPLRYAAAKLAFFAGDWGAVVENLSSTMLPTNTRERITMLLHLATAVVSTDGPEAFARGLDFVSRAETLVDASDDDPVAQVNCCKARYLCFYFAGDHVRVSEEAEAAAALSRKAGLRYEEALHLHNAGESYLRCGNVDAARTALEASNAIGSDIGVDTILQHNGVLLAYIANDAVLLQHLADREKDAGSAWRELHARYWLGRVLSLSQHPNTKGEFERALLLARELKVRVLADQCLAALESP